MAAKKKNDKKVVTKTAKPGSQLWKLYKVEGDNLVRLNQYSPKSPGDFMANHKNRKVCGKTGYTEFNN